MSKLYGQVEFYRFGCPWTSKIFSDFATPGVAVYLYRCYIILVSPFNWFMLRVLT